MEFEEQQHDIFVLIERLLSMAKQRLEERVAFSGAPGMNVGRLRCGLGV